MEDIVCLVILNQILVHYHKSHHSKVEYYKDKQVHLNQIQGHQDIRHHWIKDIVCLVILNQILVHYHKHRFVNSQFVLRWMVEHFLNFQIEKMGY